MRRCFLFAVIGLVCLLSGCDLIKIDDLWEENTDHIPYIGGEITAISLKIMSPTHVQIRWEENFGDEDGFTVTRLLVGDFSSNQIAHCGANETVVVDSTAELGEEYIYIVAAFKDGKESPGTNAQFKFTVPSPSDVGHDFNLSQPNWIKLIWINNATWADSIMITKKVGEQAWVSPYAVVPGSATEFIDENMDINVKNTWSFTTYYQNHISDQYLYTIEP